MNESTATRSASKFSVFSAPGFHDDDLTVRGTTVPARVGLLPIGELRFYIENPRVYSIVHADGEEPSQEDISEKLSAQEHVRELVADIQSHGGLIEPLLVRDVTFDVLEGNSRLAAYRILAKKDPIRWGRAKCKVLPESISEDFINSLLGQLHLRGKKEWPAYEQAGHLHRRFSRDGRSLDDLQKETGFTRQLLTKTLEAFELMVHNQDRSPKRWSYYFELIKSSHVGKARKEYANFDSVVLPMIRRDEIPSAQDLRDKLPVICKGPKRTVKRFLEGKLDFEEAHDEANHGGADNRTLATLSKFRSWLARSETEDELAEASGPVRAKIIYEIKSLSRILQALEKRVAGK